MEEKIGSFSGVLGSFLGPAVGGRRDRKFDAPRAPLSFEIAFFLDAHPHPPRLPILLVARAARECQFYAAAVTFSFSPTNNFLCRRLHAFFCSSCAVILKRRHDQKNRTGGVKN